MADLKYIIIGKLPEEEKKTLIANLKEDGIQEKGILVIELQEKNNVCGYVEKIKEFPVKKCIFISEDPQELEEASKAGMAAVGYLMPQEGKEQAKAGTEPSEGQPICGRMETDVHGETDDVEADIYAEGFGEIGIAFLLHTYERHHGIPWTILETERCIVKEFSMEELDGLFELYAGEGITDYLEPLYSYEEEKEYQEAYIKYMYGFYGYGMWMVHRKADGKVIGRIGVEHREELDGEIELGYLIGVPYQRKGYAKEVCEAVISFVREEFSFEKLNCLMEEGNIISERLAQKLGFVYQESLLLEGKIMKRYVYLWKKI